MAALILAGHGSHISPQTAGLVWQYVDQLRAWGVAEEITACFWKEPPTFRHVLSSVISETVIVVPVFTAQGYFSGTVIPAEMRLNGTVTHHQGRRIYYTPTLGEHPYVQTILWQQITDLLATEHLTTENVAIALIGHGTRRNPQSRAATQAQVDHLRRQHIAAEVVAVYLDDVPSIPDAYQLTHAPVLITVPFFLAEGSHVMLDVPAALGIDPANLPAQVNGRTVYYLPPIGTDEAVCRLIVELVASPPNPLSNWRGGIATQPVAPPSDRTRETSAQSVAPLPGERGWGEVNDIPVTERGLTDSIYAVPTRLGVRWHNFPRAGRETLTETVQQQVHLIFGELELTPDSVQPIGADSSARIIQTPSELRQQVREQPFRPLATSRDLPGNWRVPITEPEQLHAVVETVYPGAVADWANHQQGIFEAESLAGVCESQTGMFADLHKIASAGQIEATVAAVCGGCVRHPTWHFGSSPAGAIPCQSACNMWLSHLKEIVH
jgi:sirohydrochlorin cobaltochelatase